MWLKGQCKYRFVRDPPYNIKTHTQQTNPSNTLELYIVYRFLVTEKLRQVNTSSSLIDDADDSFITTCTGAQVFIFCVIGCD